MNKFLPLIALALTSCQIGPNFYELPDTSHVREEVGSRGHHGASHAGVGYRASVNACLMAKSEEECTDEEWVEEYQDQEGQGYYDGQWSGTHVNEIVAQQVFQDDNGDVIIIEDNGDVIILENPSKGKVACVTVSQTGDTYTVDQSGCVNY